MELETQEREIESQTREDRREHQRQKVRWWGQIDIGTDRFSCSVFDLSPGGARLRLHRGIPDKQRVKLMMPPFGQFEGEVSWTQDACIGIQFADAERHRVAKVIASRLNELPR